jgi:hypothetical protein
MLTLRVGGAKCEILSSLVPGHRALTVSTVLASVKGSLALLGVSAALDPGCAPCLFLAPARWPVRATRPTKKDPSLNERRFGATCPARTPGSCLGTVDQMGQLLKVLAEFSPQSE